jgi:translation initiation factor 2 alpha subunit (eIF-2alpha)
MVLRVDKEKGYIDLSKRRVSEEDVAACEERYNKSKLVHSIMRHVAETMEADVEVNLQGTIYAGLYNLYLIISAAFYSLNNSIYLLLGGVGSKRRISQILVLLDCASYRRA